MSKNTTRRRFVQMSGTATVLALAGCSGGDDSNGSSDDTESDTPTPGSAGMDGGDSMTGPTPTDPGEAPRAAIDRFSDDAGMLFRRSANDALPGPDEAVDFDELFLTRGFGPDGAVVEYYNFDVQPTAPAPIYAFFRESGDPVEGQLNVVGTVPGDDGYNDFWRVNKVTVPDSYEANTATSVSDVTEYDVETTDVIKNCPIVPEGSTADKHHGGGSAPVVEGWYDGEVVSYFLFEEDTFMTAGDGSVPLSPIYVSFNKNPDEDGGGPPSGFMTEADSQQTHNVLATTPGDEGYSPLWDVNIYDNADFGDVSDLGSAMDAELLASGAAHVNCPVVSVE